jgi:hypothetical protein
MSKSPFRIWAITSSTATSLLVSGARPRTCQARDKISPVDGLRGAWAKARHAAVTVVLAFAAIAVAVLVVFINMTTSGARASLRNIMATTRSPECSRPVQMRVELEVLPCGAPSTPPRVPHQNPMHPATPNWRIVTCPRSSSSPSPSASRLFLRQEVAHHQLVAVRKAGRRGIKLLTPCVFS